MRVGLEVITSSPEETRRLGEDLAAMLRAGDVVSLTGDLGAGKTTMVQGAARGLGVEQPVTSPTFTLVKEYRGRLPIHHMDIYRLDHVQDVLDLGFEEILDAGGVVFVEWGDAIDALLPTDHLQVTLTMPDEGEERRVEITWFGPSWGDRMDDLLRLVERWRS
jgi:tRNA threonylcarbamoyladenosine biosynthesis protein TsaE